MTDLLVSGTGTGPTQLRRAAGSGSWALVADLARVQAIRIMRHPVFLLGLAWYVVLVGLGVQAVRALANAHEHDVPTEPEQEHGVAHDPDRLHPRQVGYERPRP